MPVQKEEVKPQHEKRQRDKKQVQQDGEKKEYRPNPKFDAMKEKQQPIIEQRKHNSERINAISVAIKDLLAGRKEHVFIKNDEIRAKMNALQAEIKAIREKMDQNKVQFDEKLAEVKKTRENIPAGVSKEEHARVQIESLTYQLEHDEHSKQEERSLKDQIKKLEHCISYLPAYETLNHELDNLKKDAKKLRDELRPKLEERSKIFAQLEENDKKNDETKQDLESEKKDVKSRIEELKKERDELIAKNDELRKQCDQIYEDYKKEMEEKYKEFIARREQSENRDKMKPTLEKLYDMNVRVHEEPRWSGHFEITVRFDDADQHAQAKAGLIAALQRQEQEKKVEEVLDKVEKTLTKEEKREIKRRRQ